MNKNSAFESERLTFRGINEEDTDILVKWRSDSASVKYYRNSVAITSESHLKWLSSYLHDNSRYDFIISIKENDKQIGTVTASNINNNDKSCEIGYAVYETSERGKGYAKEAVSALIDFLKSEIKINKFFAEIHEDNIPSIKLIKSLDFKKDPFNKYILNGK